MSKMFGLVQFKQHLIRIRKKTTTIDYANKYTGLPKHYIQKSLNKSRHFKKVNDDTFELCARENYDF